MRPLHALARAVGHRRWFAQAGRALVPADRFVGRLTGGRLVALGLVPSLLLTTTGRRSGRPHQTPLQGVSDGDGLVVIGSNWGGPRQPAWALNLLARPEATVTRHGRSFPVRAHRLTGAERDRAWQAAVHQWPAYQRYVERAGGREFHIFRLHRTD